MVGPVTRQGLRFVAALVVVAASTLALAGSALPTITPTTSASDLANAIAIDASVVTGASFAIRTAPGDAERGR